MAWLQGEVFKCSNADCECEVTLTKASKRTHGSFLPDCCCCGRLMMPLTPTAT
jgi:hypothetical protein